MTEKHSHVIIESKNGGSYYCELDLEDKTPLGCSKSIDYVLEHLMERADNIRREREVLKKQLYEAKRDLQRENPYRENIQELKQELREIDDLLGAQTNEDRSA